MRIARWRALAVCALTLTVAAPLRSSAHAQGTITGRITNEANQPLANASVLAVGTNAAVTTNEDGRFTLRNIRSGVVDVQALHVGYQSLKRTVTVPSGASIDASMQLRVAIVKLEEIVTTATGQQRKVELGNAVATLGDVSKRVEESSVTNISDLLVAKTPGVILLPSPVVGGAPTIRMRGVSSIALSNAPIWVVDGVRYNTATSAASAGSTPISALNNLSPEEIEDVEIVKGPSAATLYGTNAANGVIVITTKRGRPGAARWNFAAESRTISDRNHYQEQYANFGKRISSTGAISTVTRCQLAVMQTPKFSFSQGATCVSDSVTKYNFLEDPDNTFIHLGRGSLFGMNVSGGNEGLRYFVSGDLDNEFGPIQMSQKDLNFYNDSLHVPVTNSMFHPRQLQRLNLRSNLSAAISPKLDMNISAGFAKSDHIIEPDNAQIIALLYLGQANFGYKGCPKGTEKTGCGLDKAYTDPTGFPLNDADTFAPGSVMQFYTPVDVQRFTGSTQANWRPLSWLQTDGTVGVDLFVQDIFHVCRVGECPNSGANARLGNVSDQKVNRRNFSAKLASTASWQARPTLNFKTTVGSDYTNEERDSVYAQGRGLPVGATTVQAAATFVNYGTLQPTAVKTFGFYLQELVALNDRMFLTIGARSDQNSAFGTNFQRVLYPKIGLSWILSDEPRMPKFDWLNSFQLRSAYGANGVQPGATDALQTFTPSVSTLQKIDPVSGAAATGVDVAGLIANLPGNADLKPERSTELEVGFATDLFGRRLHLDYTHYRKKSTDALIRVPVPPSSGSPVANLLLNLGSNQNIGHELQANIQLLERKSFSWDAVVSLSRNDNKWIELGLDPATGADRIIGAGGTTQQRQDYPLNGQWYRNYTYADANGDGIIQVSEVQVDSALKFQGIGFAKDLFSISTGFDLFSRKLRINMLFDHKGGGRTLEGNYFQCSSFPQACQETQDPNAPLDLQARAVALKYGTRIGGTTYTTRLGYFVPFDFWKFRELSGVVTMPDRLTRALRAAPGSSFVVALRNLHTWTNFTGVDPEQNYGLTGAEVQQDFNTSPTPSYLTLRLNLKY